MKRIKKMGTGVTALLFVFALAILIALLGFSMSFGFLIAQTVMEFINN